MHVTTESSVVPKIVLLVQIVSKATRQRKLKVILMYLAMTRKYNIIASEVSLFVAQEDLSILIAHC